MTAALRDDKHHLLIIQSARRLGHDSTLHVFVVNELNYALSIHLGPLQFSANQSPQQFLCTGLLLSFPCKQDMLSNARP